LQHPCMGTPRRHDQPQPSTHGGTHAWRHGMANWSTSNRDGAAPPRPHAPPCPPLPPPSQPHLDGHARVCPARAWARGVVVGADLMGEAKRKRRHACGLRLAAVTRLHRRVCYRRGKLDRAVAGGRIKQKERCAVTREGPDHLTSRLLLLCSPRGPTASCASPPVASRARAPEGSPNPTQIMII
jgi:hypothetical protein